METSGVIKSIQLINFMCHDNFKINLNPRLNFIGGRNGSGKSAVQTALVIGLGGRAGWTGRGCSVKDLVKRGKNYCIIRITLTNTGHTAFNFDLYGEEITVERQIAVSGTSSYKLKSESGTVISKCKGELDKMVVKFHIQINNPIAILHQDIARCFLNVDDPKEKYKFFAQALLLDCIEQQHGEVNINTREGYEVMTSKMKRLENAFADIQELRRKINTLEILEGKNRRREQVRNELAWAKVEEEQESLNKHLRQIEKIELNINRIKTVLENCNENNPLLQKKADLEKDLNHIQENIEMQTNKITNKTNMLRKRREDLDIMNNKMQKSKKKLKSLSDKIPAVEEFIYKITHRDPELEKQREADKIQLNTWKENLLDLDSVIHTSEVEHNQLVESVDKLRNDLEKHSQQKRHLSAEYAKQEENIRKLKRETNNLSMYDSFMPALVAAIKAERGFEEQPRGPLGAYIKVRDPSWTAAVEQVINRRTLGAFCVSNQKDYTILQNIMRQVCPNNVPTIFRGKFFNKVHKVQEVLLNGYCNLFRALDIKDPVVANCLIDNLEVETVLLIPTNEEAFKIMGNVDNVPNYCKRAFTKQADVFYPAPNYRSYAGDLRSNQALLLQVDNKHTIRVLEENGRDLLKQSKDVETLKSVSESHLLNLQKTVNKLDIDLSNYRKKRQKLMSAIRHLEEKGDQEDNQTVVPRQVEEELRELQQQKIKEEENLKNFEDPYISTKSEVEDLEVEVQGIRQNLESFNTEKSSIAVKILKIDSLIRNKSIEETKYKEKLSQQEDLLVATNEVLEKTQTELKKLTADAQYLAPEGFLEPRRVAEVMAELHQLEIYINTVEKETGGELVEMKSKIEERKTVYNNYKLILDTFKHSIDGTVNKLDFVIKKHKSSVENFGHIVSTTFDTCLELCNYKGELEFNHENEELRINVHPLIQSSDSVRSTSSLSGGEKSYATAAFIMSIWSHIKLPFYFLDEFDVFMDMRNRETILNVLIHRARSLKRQFVFLTPLNIAYISPAEDLQVFRLDPPTQDL